VSDFLPRRNSGVPLAAQMPVNVISGVEIILVLNEAESYHWSPLLRVGGVVHANTRCQRGRCTHYP
jgi:hypothetical protein